MEPPRFRLRPHPLTVRVDMARPRIGVWLIGAKGGVAVTTITGLIALGRGLTGSTGLVSELP